MKNTLEKFIKEIDSIEKIACSEPYNLDDYDDDKTRKILLDIDLNKNHSWIKEIWERNKSRLNYIAILYRGQKFTYEDFFLQSYRYAKALKVNGVKKGQEFVCAIENTPEFPFIMGAASIIGARVNLVSSEFDRDYLIEMVNRAEVPYIFVSDMSFIKFAPIMKSVGVEKKIIPISIDYSLVKGNPYKEITEKFYKLDKKTYDNLIDNTPNVMDINEFLQCGDNYTGKVVEQMGLNDDFTTTYTSGSTGWGRPKALIHRVRSYITMGRYHDSEVSGIPSMEKRTTMALCKTMSDTDFMSNISDTFMQGGTVALEPINDKEFFLSSLLINKPTLAIASRSYWIYLMKEYKFNDNIKNIKLPFLLVPTAAGEPMAANEEKALNRWLKDVEAGTNITKIPIVKMSIAGGDSEHGGIFLSLFRSLQSKMPSHIGINEPVGMNTYGMVQVKALREDGTYCNHMELGKLVANSPCTMEGYVNNQKANDSFFIRDAYGKLWGNLNTYGYVDKTNHIYVKGRISKDDLNIPTFMVSDIILKDTKKIMSCEVVNVNNGSKKVYVAHIEPQIGVSFNKEKVLESAKERCKKIFGEEFINDLYFRIRENEESFELLHTGKRNNIALVQEGISEKCIQASELLVHDDKRLIKKKEL